MRDGCGGRRWQVLLEVWGSDSGRMGTGDGHATSLIEGGIHAEESREPLLLQPALKNFDVFIVGPDPEPCKNSFFPKGQNAIIIGHSRRPKLAYGFQLQRRMAGILHQQSELLIRRAAGCLREHRRNDPKTMGEPWTRRSPAALRTLGESFFEWTGFACGNLTLDLVD